MIKIVEITNENRGGLLRFLDKRNEVDLQPYKVAVEKILQEVKKRGDVALLEYTKTFDQVELRQHSLKVSEKELEEAQEKVGEDFKLALRLAISKIRTFHQKQKERSWFSYEEDGVILGQKVTPISTVGIYVPGGTAPYPSSVLMNAIPAMVAGVERIVMVTPPNPEGTVDAGVLVAARELGIKEIYKVGGAQAIGALAYGTDTIPKVDKIVGPGNIYVATAKGLVYGGVDIDMVAGPSEILVIADETANPQYVAADLLSQAEHDELASALCITTSKSMAEAVKAEILLQTERLDRREIIKKSLKDYGGIYIVKDLKEAVELANIIAPEHLELSVEKPFELLAAVRNAGAIFLGHYTPEAVGDYMAGPNHVLPTGGTARFFSPLGLEDFTKKSSVIFYPPQALEKIKEEVMVFAGQEGLNAHKNAVKVRFENND